MKIYVKPRIHISLISMHCGGYRKNGGMGFSIEEPKGLLEFSVSDQFTLSDKRKVGLGEAEQIQLFKVLSDVQSSLGLEKSIGIELSGGLHTHVGMGSGTAVRLACLEALLLINGKSTDQDSLIALSRRGGASGIGIQTYFSGQFVFDLGVRNNDDVFTPSSKSHVTQKPLLLDRCDFPSWTVGLCIPSNIPSKTQAEEKEFFAKACPIQAQQSYEALYCCLFGAYAAVKEKDINSFAKSIKDIQSCEWKRLERNEYTGNLFRLEKALYAYGALCVGMSSLGPTLYFLAPEDKHSFITSQMKDEDCAIIFTRGSNSGREVVIQNA